MIRQYSCAARFWTVSAFCLAAMLLCTCSKEAKNNPVAAADAKLLIGIWNLSGVRSVDANGNVYEVPSGEIDDDPLTYAFHDDGSALQVYQDEEAEFSWEAQGSRLTIDYMGFVQQYTYTVTDGSLSLVFISFDDETQESYTITHRFNRQPECPSSITLAHLDQLPIEDWKQLTGDAFLTGVGACAAMRVGKHGQYWDGITIAETVTADPNGDPCQLAALVSMPEGYFCSCQGVPCIATFTVGAKLSGSPAGVAEPEPNVFWDFHKITSPTSALLQHFGLTTCTVTCLQDYSCKGTVIARYRITYTLTRDAAAGVTRVSVDKAAI